MKKLLTIFTMLIVLFTLSGCKKDDEPADQPTVDQPVDIVVDKVDKISVKTTIGFYSDRIGTIIPIYNFVIGSDIYVYVDMEFTNTNDAEQKVEMEAVVPNAEYVSAWFREGNAYPDVETEDTLEGTITRFSGMAFNIQPGKSDMQYVFLIRGTDAGPGRFQIEYSDAVKDLSDKFVGFHFVGVDSLPRLALPVITLSEDEVSWTESVLNTGYILFINDQEIGSYQSNAYSSQYLQPGEFTFKVAAKGDGYEFNDSEFVEITFEKLNATTLTFDGTKLMWDAVTDATGYEITSGDETYNVVGTEFVVATPNTGSYSYSIRAISNSQSVISSDSSDEYTITKLDTPTIADGGGLFITWSEITDATSYHVYLNDVYYGEVFEEQFRKVAGSNVSVKIIAVGTGLDIIESDQSNSITYNLG